MTSDSMPERRVRPLGLTDTESYVYETIASLQYAGHPVTREELVATADLDDETLDWAIAALAGRQLVTVSTVPGEQTYQTTDPGLITVPDGLGEAG